MAKAKVDVCKKILDYFRENPDASIRPLSLSNEINEDANLVEEVLKRCRSFFLYLPTEQVYKLNKSGEFKGDIVMMKINAEDALQEKSFFRKHWYLIVLTVLVAASFAILNKMG